MTKVEQIKQYAQFLFDNADLIVHWLYEKYDSEDTKQYRTMELAFHCHKRHGGSFDIAFELFNDKDNDFTKIESLNREYFAGLTGQAENPPLRKTLGSKEDEITS